MDYLEEIRNRIGAMIDAAPAEWRDRLRYGLLYGLILREIENLKSKDLDTSYQLVKALAACYELQEYTAGRLVEEGESEE